MYELSSCALTVISLLVLLPLRVVAQEPPRPPARLAISGANCDASPSPTPDASPTPRDPMSTPTFNGSDSLDWTSVYFRTCQRFCSRSDESVALLRRRRIRRRVEDSQRRITWTPVFDNEASYSIGAIALDPKNPLTFGSALARTTASAAFRMAMVL
jgi:hypothetical protein